jgi:hypothetical protein
VNTPTQKALIQLGESMAITALIAGIASLNNVLVGTGSINWNQTAINFGLAVMFSLAHSLSAYLKAVAAKKAEQEQQSGQAQAQIDLSPLSAVLDAFINNLEQRFNTVKAPAAVTSATVQPPATTAAPVAQPSQPAQIDWSATNPAFKAVNLVPPAQQQ